MFAYKTVLILFIFFEIYYTQECDSEPESTNLYDKDFNKWLQLISSQNKSYIPCINGKEDCNCFLGQIDKDLQHFPHGIQESQIESAKSRGTKYQIIDHKLYRDSSCMFPSRCSGIEFFLKQTLDHLPDMEFIVNTRDYPQVSKAFNEKLPVFSFSRTNSDLDIMYPAWSFWAGGPAITLHPTGIGRWDKHRNSIAKAAKKFPWSEKESIGYFRGSRTSDERDSIVKLSRKHSDLVDAQYTKNQAWKSKEDTLGRNPASEVSFEEHCRYKYLFNYRGVAASFRFKHLFLCKSLVFHVGNEWQEFFYSDLKPWIHYIPLDSYPSEDEIQKLITFFQDHDELAERIALNGYKQIWSNLKLKDITCYWKNLLEKYSKLIKYDVKKDENLIKIK